MEGALSRFASLLVAALVCSSPWSIAEPALAEETTVVLRGDRLKARILPTGDYRIRTSIRQGVETLALAEVDKILEASRRGRCTADKRPSLAMMATIADARIKALLPQMREESEDDYQNYVLRLRGGGRWRLVATSAAENYPIVDTSFDGSRVIRTGTRQKNGERMAVFEDLDPLYLAVGPLQMIDMIQDCEEIAAAEGSSYHPEGGDDVWVSALESLSDSSYNNLALPTLCVGMGCGKVVIRRTSTSLALAVSDTDGKLLVRRTIGFNAKHLNKYVEEQWFPGYADSPPNQVLTHDLIEFTPVAAGDELCPAEYWTNTRIVDMRGGQMRQAFAPKGLLTDEEFDRIWSAENRPPEEPSAFNFGVLIAVAVSLILLGVIGRKVGARRAVERP